MKKSRGFTPLEIFNKFLQTSQALRYKDFYEI